MDALLRGRRLLLTLTALAACRGEPGAPVGVSSPRADAWRDGGPEAGAGRRPSPVGADFRGRLARVMERQVSRGHAERYDGIVWANEVARASWDGTGDFADDALLVEEAIDRTGKGERPAGLFVMEKKGGTWSFVTVGKDGEVGDDAGVAACVTCHREAPRDFVFRVTPAAPAPSASK